MIEKPEVVQQKDMFSLEVILTHSLQVELLKKGLLIGDFKKYDGQKDTIKLLLDSTSRYHCSQRGYELSITYSQLLSPNKDLQYISNSIYEDSSRGNPLRIRIKEDF